MEKKEIEKDKKISSELFPSELKLIKFIREIKWGTFEIVVQQGHPVVIKKAIQTIKLEKGDNALEEK